MPVKPVLHIIRHVSLNRCYRPGLGIAISKRESIEDSSGPAFHHLQQPSSVDSATRVVIYRESDFLLVTIPHVP